jgi:hypothetical protein
LQGISRSDDRPQPKNPQLVLYLGSIAVEAAAQTGKTSLQVTHFRVCHCSYIQGAFKGRVFFKEPQQQID